MKLKPRYKRPDFNQPRLSMKEEVLLNLRRMLDAADRIQEFTEGMRPEDFAENQLLRDGVIRNIEIMRLNALQLDHDFIQEYANQAWEMLINSGNGKPQDLVQFDTEKIWLLIRYSIPQIREQISRTISGVAG